MLFTRSKQLLLMILLLAGSIMLTSPQAQAADRVYEKPSDFLKRQFSGKIPATQALSLNTGHQARIKRLLGHAYSPSKVRYWSDGRKTVWILDEIGKTLDITTAFVISKGKIAEVKVLIYRESHGWEVTNPTFTKQFKGASLSNNGQLTRKINGISGATLSVRALTKLGRTSLFLDSQKP